MVLAAVLLPAAGLAAGQPAAELAEAAQALRDGRFQAAHQQLQRLLAAQPGDARLLTLDGMALAGMQRPAESLKAYDRALSASPGYLPALLGKAQVQYQSGAKDTAATLNRILKLDPGNATAHAMLGSLAYERRDCARAIAHFEKGRAQVLSTPPGAWQFAQCLLVAGRAAEAVPLFERLTASRPADDRARFNLGLALCQAGRYGEAIQALRPLSLRSPPQSDALSLLAEAYRREQNLPEAISVLRKAIELYPRQEQHYLDLGALCADYNALDLGLEVLEVGSRNIPSSPAIRMLRGMLFVQKGEFQNAEVEFEQADRLSPEKVYRAIGSTYASMFGGPGDLERSLASLRQELKKKPQDAVLNYLLGEALLRQQVQPGDPEFAEAQQALERSVKLQPAFAKAHSALGRLYWKLDRVPESIREFETALRLDPADQFTLYRLAMALNSTGREQESRKLVQKLRQIKEEERRSGEAKQRLRLIKDAPKQPSGLE